MSHFSSRIHMTRFYDLNLRHQGCQRCLVRQQSSTIVSKKHPTTRRIFTIIRFKTLLVKLSYGTQSRRSLQAHVTRNRRLPYTTKISSSKLLMWIQVKLKCAKSTNRWYYLSINSYRCRLTREVWIDSRWYRQEAQALTAKKVSR